MRYYVVKINKITIKGFRGFNKEQSIEFDPRLTLIYGPNSYGKTSISEAFEWLLYGATSKLESADSKDEYKGSYRNRHLPATEAAFVSLIVHNGGEEQVLLGKLTKEEDIERGFNKRAVSHWPFGSEMYDLPKPFILQHALKNLLLVEPKDRFQGFAKLLGFKDLDGILTNVVKLCTKPEAKIPQEIDKLIRDVEALEKRLAAQESLASINKEYKKGLSSIQNTYDAIIKECRKKIGTESPMESILPRLISIRDEAINKIFSHSVTITDYTNNEKQNIKSDEDFFLSFTAEEFIRKFNEIINLSTLTKLAELANFYDLGMKIIAEHPGKCPFCGQNIGESMEPHIRDKHKRLSGERERLKEIDRLKGEVTQNIDDLKRRIKVSQELHEGKTSQLLELNIPAHEPEKEPELLLNKLKKVLCPKHETLFVGIENSLKEFDVILKALKTSYIAVTKTILEIETSLKESREGSSLLQKLGESIINYINESRMYAQTVSTKGDSLVEADKVLKHELDLLAGTEDIVVLIDLIENKERIKKRLEIQAILDELKVLRKSTEHFVADKMFSTITEQLTEDVMYWYEQIRTTGDPDVHFDGFDMEKTQKGEYKSRRVQIKAKSYGKDLVSAVSSLSESKLNALGLCVCIATNMKMPSPFDFIIIDDPIQSWDAEHEVQFIEIIKEIIKRGKQVVLLSHNLSWINQIRSGSRSLNGKLFKIRGYNVDGPDIVEEPWAPYKERLNEVNAILRSTSPSDIQLQQAEEEIRIVVAELAAKIYLERNQQDIKASKLNDAEVRRILLESGVSADLVNRVSQTFVTTNDAHHAPVNYVAVKERIKRYHSWAHELAQELER